MPLVQSKPSSTASRVQLPVLAVTQAGEETILQLVKKKGEKNQVTISQHGPGMSSNARQDRDTHNWLCTAIESNAFFPGNPFLFHIAFQAQA